MRSSMVFAEAILNFCVFCTVAKMIEISLVGLVAALRDSSLVITT